MGFRVLGTGLSLTPQVELRPVRQALQGQPTTQGQVVRPASGQAQTLSLTISGLRPSTSYRWQARVVDGQGKSSAWTAFPVRSAGASAFSVDTTAPVLPSVNSPTNPHYGWWYNTRSERFNWRSTDWESGIAGYSFRVDHQTGGTPGALTQQTSLTLTNLADGRWVLHLWARDRAGNWSNGTGYKFNLDTTAPKITPISTSTHDFNPYVGVVTWRYAIDQWAHVTLDIRRSGQSGPVLVVDMGTLAPGNHYLTWNGKSSAGTLSLADWHWFHVTAKDGVGNSSNRAFGGIHVTPVAPAFKRIVVSLARQTITAYESGRVVWSSLATTGNFALSPTPPGHYHIFARYSPFQFVSPWPPGDPLWYPSDWSTYAMEFISGGYFIHDAPWRSVFGPGSQEAGRPGTDYGGTHGCVNVPVSTAAFLWKWAPLGTDVDVVAVPADGEVRAIGKAGP